MLFSTITIVLDKSYAKYVSSISGYATTQTAVSVTTNTLNELSYKLDDMLPGDEKTYTFSVQNFDNGGRTQTAMEYYFYINNSNDIPYTISLYKNDENTNILFYNDNTNRYESNANILGFSDDETDEYELVINWDGDYTSSLYNGKVDYIDITIRSNQKIGD